MDELEQRTFVDGVELRLLEEAERPTRIVGMAVPYNTLSQPLGGGRFRERILPGAFADSLGSGVEIRADIEHDPKLKLGRKTRGTLVLRDEPQGLMVEIEPPNTTLGRDSIVEVRRGDLSGFSIAFRNAKDSWRKENGELIREIHAAGLVAITLTGNPAYPDAAVALRSLDSYDTGEASERSSTMRLRLELAERRKKSLTESVVGA